MGQRKILSLACSKSTFFAFLFFILCHKCFHVSAVKMVSTSTQEPEGLTTPHDSNKNTKKYKSELADFVTLAVSLKSLQPIEQILTNSSGIKNMENKLKELQHIVNVSEHYYKFQMKEDFSKPCSYEYENRKRFLKREFEILLNECKNTMESVDVLHFSEIQPEDKKMIHACSERTKTLPADVSALVENIFQLSYICALENVKHVLQEMSVTKFFSFFDENSKLTIQEIDYLLQSFEHFMQTINPEVNFTSTFVDKDLLKMVKIDFEKIKKVTKTGVMERSIKNFTEAVQAVLDQDVKKMKKTYFHKDDDDEKYVLQLGSALTEGIYENHLKVPTIKPEHSIENWSNTPGVFKVVLMNRLLKEMLKTIATLYQKHFKLINGVHKEKKRLDLYTKTSSTFGKPCVNIPKHLVGTCTPENHEVCREILVSWEIGNDPEILENHDASLLRHFPELKHCTCGYLTDCEKSLASFSKICFLVSNVDGQCRGGEGYPCKTHPLEPGKYDESCISGYCNWKENSCKIKSSTSDADTIEKVQRFANDVKNKLRDFIN